VGAEGLYVQEAVREFHQDNKPHLCDLIVLTGPASRQKYPSVLRRVRAVVEVDGRQRQMEFLATAHDVK
jgi:hypothetical protein